MHLGFNVFYFHFDTFKLEVITELLQQFRPSETLTASLCPHLTSQSFGRLNVDEFGNFAGVNLGRRHSVSWKGAESRVEAVYEEQAAVCTALCMNPEITQ